MHTVNLLTNLVEHHEVLAYGLIFLGLILEGEMVVIATGILAHLGALNIWFALIFILAGAIFKIFFGYNLGKFLFKKFNHSKFLQYLEKKVSRILPKFDRKPFWSIFISKFIASANYWVIIFAGYRGIRFKTYLKAEFLSTAIWAPLMLFLGYVFSYTALLVSREIWRFTLIILILVIAYIIFDKIVGWLYELFEELHGDI